MPPILKDTTVLDIIWILTRVNHLTMLIYIVQQKLLKVKKIASIPLRYLRLFRVKMRWPLSYEDHRYKIQWSLFQTFGSCVKKRMEYRRNIFRKCDNNHPSLTLSTSINDDKWPLASNSRTPQMTIRL